MKKTQSEKSVTKKPPLTAKVIITNKRGLHARASAKFVQCAQRFQAKVHVRAHHERVGGSSIMGLLMLQAAPGTELLLEASGKDAQDALQALSELVKNKFDEEGITDNKTDKT